MEVIPASYVVVSTNTINVSVLVGNNATSTTFQVWDGNGTTLDSIDYNISEIISWLSITPTSGSSNSPSDKQTHTINFNTSALAVGNYSGVISVVDEESLTSETITVNLAVSSGSYIVADPTEISETTPVSVDPDDIQLDIWDGNSNIGDAINFNITKTEDWLTISPTSGTSTNSSNKSQHTISFDVSALTPGIYSDDITITDTSGAGSITIPVQLTIESGAYLVSDTSGINLELSPNSAYEGIFKVWDGNSTTLDNVDYVITNSSDWLIIDPLTGESDSPSEKIDHSFLINTSNLSSGEYNDIIIITDLLSSDELQIPVQININQINKVGVAYGAFSL
jgi:hypothetical protein